MKPMMKTFVTAALGITLIFPAVASAHTYSIKSGASDLRITLESLLGEHAELAVIAMQKGIDGAADFNDVSAALLDNGDDLSAAIGSVYGADAAKSFKGLWNTHIGFFVDYVTSTAKKDEAGRKAALDKLERYGTDFGAFLESANPNLKAADVADGLKSHVSQLIEAFDDYVNKDYAGAYKADREAYTHMIHFGHVLADAIVKQYPDKFTNQGASVASVDLRSGLDALLSEHGGLAVLAMQKGISGAPDFDAAAGALLANSDDLTAAITSVYGEGAGKAFKGLWNTHIGFFVDYVKATAAKDESKRKETLDKLNQYGTDFGAFLEAANPNNFKTADIAGALKPHVAQLVKAFDSYVNKDYPQTYASAREAYAHMSHTGDYLASGIVAQFQEKFHDPKTPDMTSTMKIWLKIGSSNIMIDDKSTMMDTAPFMWEGNTYVPLRFLAEGIGANVTWDQASQTAWVKAGNDTLTFWVGKDDMEVNGMKKEIGAPVVLKDGRTQVPLRFITELLGWDVKWNEADGSITLIKAMAMEPGMEMGSHMHE
ncbi:copper amine oxidase N-terminal domain-containing protein [Paenibacillus chondroitinus]|uniref:Copper amine oxidase N-terminal domain-containing protein n=1 Tax=Paenibacillus chondroitinus TaxID=59842 RepID=A0ABU6DAG1_9BACL|nr:MULTISPECIES: copper amine oxidase N-terminal domain-containing protein [Paenibacillus]MCY9661825.1 copper amine oxidase N-terminal domain-containing protein [Paenibacillus anseongense]MEB4793911.1 copper amine oxidase N-terminal domain-containing protein [Paenibacillus chondroitinus]